MVELEMVVHLFGAKSSPAVVTFVLRYHGERISGEAPEEVLYAIMKGFYVDDFLNSYPTVEKARGLRVALTEALRLGGFELTKWRSTHPSVLDGVSPLDGEPEDVKMFSDASELEPSEKVLGVAYSFRGDHFAIRIHERIRQEAISRRQMLSLIASVFDLLGLVAPAVLKGKTVFQKATQLGVGWDDH